MARIEIDIEDYLDEVSDNVIRMEYERRLKKKNPYNDGADFKIPKQSAIETLDEVGRLLRKMGRVDLAYKVDETRVDYVEIA